MEVPVKSEKARNRTGDRSRIGEPDALAREISQLVAFDAPALRRRWVELMGDDPPLNLGRKMMLQAIAYHAQERTFGGLKPSTLRILDRVADGPASAESKRAPTRRASAGTVLIRQWHGVSHRVTVLDHEVVYRGRRYKSLSEVARVITSTRWSGPVFFGLKNRAKEAANG
jgi:Protein of unknown function (DUF2924)